MWNNQEKNNSNFVDQAKNFLINFLLWGDEPETYLMYTDEDGGEGRIILEDHSFANLPKNPSIFQNQVKHSN